MKNFLVNDSEKQTGLTLIASKNKFLNLGRYLNKNPDTIPQKSSSHTLAAVSDISTSRYSKKYVTILTNLDCESYATSNLSEISKNIMMNINKKRDNILQDINQNYSTNSEYEIDLSKTLNEDLQPTQTRESFSFLGANPGENNIDDCNIVDKLDQSVQDFVIPTEEELDNDRFGSNYSYSNIWSPDAKKRIKPFKSMGTTIESNFSKITNISEMRSGLVINVQSIKPKMFFS